MPILAFNKKNVNRWLLLFTLAGLALYLVCAERIVVSLTGTGKEVRAVTQLPTATSAKLFHAFDPSAVRAEANLTLRYHMEGLALLESSPAAYAPDSLSPRQVEVFLIGPEISYAIPTNLTLRPDIAQHFPDRVKGLAPDQLLGFYCDFSALPIRDGIYELAFFIYENDKLQGLTKTGIRYQMSGKGLKRLDKK